MSSGNEQVIKYFIMEAYEHLEAMQAALGNLQPVIEEYEECNTIYRAAHTIKGGAAMLGFEGIRHLSLLLENCFKYLREHPVKIDAQGHSTFTHGITLLHQQIQALEGGSYDDPAASQQVQAQEPALSALYEQIKQLGEANAPKPLPADFAPQAMNLLRHMVGLFKQPASPQARAQLGAICQKLSQMGEGYDLWQKLLAAVRIAVTHPQVPYAAVASAIVRDVKAGIDLLVEGKATNIALGPELQRFAAAAAKATAAAAAAPPAPAPAAATPPAPAARPAPAAAPAAAAPAVPAGHLLIPLEVKGAARALIGAMPKDRLMELAKYLAMAARQ